MKNEVTSMHASKKVAAALLWQMHKEVFEMVKKIVHSCGFQPSNFGVKIQIFPLFENEWSWILGDTQVLELSYQKGTFGYQRVSMDLYHTSTQRV